MTESLFKRSVRDMVPRKIDLSKGFLTGWFLAGFPTSTNPIRNIVAQETEQTDIISMAWNSVLTELERNRLSAYADASLSGITKNERAAEFASCSTTTIKNHAETALTLLKQFIQLWEDRELTKPCPQLDRDSFRFGEPSVDICTITPELAWTPTLVLRPAIASLSSAAEIFGNKYIPYLGTLVPLTHHDLVDWKGFSPHNLVKLDVALAELGLRLAKGEGESMWWTDLPNEDKNTCLLEAQRLNRDVADYWRHTLKHVAHLYSTSRANLISCLTKVLQIDDSESLKLHPAHQPFVRNYHAIEERLKISRMRGRELERLIGELAKKDKPISTELIHPDSEPE